MKRLLGVVLLTLLLAAPGMGAQLWVEVRLEPSEQLVTGQTLQLQVDVLTDTWFTSAPQLPVLEIDNTIISAPSGEARHLNLTRNGTALFGLQYSYQITPTAAGDFLVAPLTISATQGQAPGPVTQHSAPVHFRVEQPAGIAPGRVLLVARDLKLSQQIVQSSDKLAIGDSVRRQIDQIADGAQMMLIPSPGFAKVRGLGQYAGTPILKTIDDGRGNVTGGSRSDSVTYSVQHGGEFQLPPVTVQWWDSDAHQLRTAELPGVTFKAAATAFKTPFSISEDLQRLGQHGRISLSRHWLGVGLTALVLALMLYLGWPRLLRAGQWLRQRRASRRQQWLASPGYAFKQIPIQLSAQPPRIDALYLWGRRQFGSTGVQGHVPADPIRMIYSHERQLGTALKALSQLERSPRRYARRPDTGLRALNPRLPETEPRL
jgi:hypothetical protein